MSVAFDGAVDGETVGVRLRRLRLERGLSQRELSSAGTSYAYISRIEAGTRRPSVRALRQLAAKLDVDPDYLEFGADGVKANPTFRAMQRRIVRLEAEKRALERRLKDMEAERRDVVAFVRTVAGEIVASEPAVV